MGCTAADVAVAAVADAVEPGILTVRCSSSRNHCHCHYCYQRSSPKNLLPVLLDWQVEEVEMLHLDQHLVASEQSLDSKAFDYELHIQKDWGQLSISLVDHDRDSKRSIQQWTIPLWAQLKQVEYPDTYTHNNMKIAPLQRNVCTKSVNKQYGTR